MVIGDWQMALQTVNVIHLSNLYAPLSIHRPSIIVFTLLRKIAIGPVIFDFRRIGNTFPFELRKPAATSPHASTQPRTYGRTSQQPGHQRLAQETPRVGP